MTSRFGVVPAVIETPAEENPPSAFIDNNDDESDESTDSFDESDSESETSKFVFLLTDEGFVQHSSTKCASYIWHYSRKIILGNLATPN